jgi:hypothetical protein
MEQRLCDMRTCVCVCVCVCVRVCVRACVRVCVSFLRSDHQERTGVPWKSQVLDLFKNECMRLSVRGLKRLVHEALSY